MTHQKGLDSFVRIARMALKDEIQVVVEVGARDCRETLAFANAFPRARIFAFECNPDTLPMCRQNVTGIQSIRLIEKAVASRNGTVSFFKIDTDNTKTTLSDGNPGASSLFRASGKYKVEDYVQVEVSVPAITLKQFMNDEQLGQMDLLWMDLQGAELMALEGLEERIHDVKLIHTEVEFMEIYKNQPLYRDLKQFLKRQGFRLIGFTYFGRYSADAVFVNSNLVSGWRMPESLIYYWHKGTRTIDWAARQVNPLRALGNRSL